MFKKIVEYSFQGVVTIISGVIVRQISELIEMSKLLSELEEELLDNEENEKIENKA